MHIARHEELAVFEVVVFEVFQAVAHIGLATEEFVLPDDLAVAQDAAGARQMLGQFAHAQLRAETATAQLGMGHVQVILALHHMVGELVAYRKTQAIGFTVMPDHIEAADFRLFAGVFGERRHREGLARAHDDAAIAFVEPLRLHTGLASAWFAALHAPFEDAHGVGHRAVVAGLLVHLVAGRGTAQVGKAGAADQHMGRVWVVQRRQDFVFRQQGGVVMAAAQAEGFYLLLQLAAGIDGGQREFTHAVGAAHFAYLVAFYHADAALTVAQLELN